MVGDSRFELETPVLSVPSYIELVGQLLGGIITLGHVANQLKTFLESNEHRHD
jgi:hypothetical protein